MGPLLPVTEAAEAAEATNDLGVSSAGPAATMKVLSRIAALVLHHAGAFR